MLKELALGDLRHELGNTRRVLERVPDHQLDWRPHDRSWTLGELATHLVNLVTWNSRIIERASFDLADARRADAYDSRQELLDAFDSHTAHMQTLIEGTSDEALQQEWQLRRGDHVVLSMPRLAAIRTMGISHMVHHRGQLCVYFRLLDLPVPGLYGPSADEQ